MTKDKLRQYVDLQREIEMLTGELKATPMATDVVTASSDEIPYGQHPLTITGYDSKHYQRTCRRLAKCQALVAEIEGYIETVDDSLIRQLLKLRYVERLSWSQVAAKFEGRYSEAYLRKMMSRYLAKS